jgi:hypothetical protein
MVMPELGIFPILHGDCCASSKERSLCCIVLNVHLCPRFELVLPLVPLPSQAQSPIEFSKVKYAEAPKCLRSLYSLPVDMTMASVCIL